MIKCGEMRLSVSGFSVLASYGGLFAKGLVDDDKWALGRCFLTDRAILKLRCQPAQIVVTG